MNDGFNFQDILHTQEQNLALQYELLEYRKTTDDQLQYLKVNLENIPVFQKWLKLYEVAFMYNVWHWWLRTVYKTLELKQEEWLSHLYSCCFGFDLYNLISLAP